MYLSYFKLYLSSALRSEIIQCPHHCIPTRCKLYRSMEVINKKSHSASCKLKFPSPSNLHYATPIMSLTNTKYISGCGLQQITIIYSGTVIQSLELRLSVSRKFKMYQFHGKVSCSSVIQRLATLQRACYWKFYCIYTLAIKVTLLRQDFKCHYLLCIYMYRKQSNYMFSDIITQKKTKRFNILWKQRQSIM